MLNIYEAMVVFWISDFMGKNNTCWPSHKKLASVCRISKTTLIKTLKSLEEKGIVEIKKSNNKSNTYSFNLFWIESYRELLIKLSPNYIKILEDQGCQRDTPGGTPRAPGGTPRAPERNIKNVINNKKIYVEKQSNSYQEGGHESGEMPKWLEGMTH